MSLGTCFLILYEHIQIVIYPILSRALRSSKNLNLETSEEQFALSFDWAKFSLMENYHPEGAPPLTSFSFGPLHCNGQAYKIYWSLHLQSLYTLIVLYTGRDTLLVLYTVSASTIYWSFTLAQLLHSTGPLHWQSLYTLLVLYTGRASRLYWSFTLVRLLHSTGP